MKPVKTALILIFVFQLFMLGFTNSPLDVENSRRGIDVLLFIDNSGSMVKNDPKKLRWECSKLLVDSLNSEDRLAVFSFNSQPVMNAPLQNLSSEEIRNSIKVLFDKISSRGATDLLKAVSLAQEYIDSGKVKASPYLIILSDGVIDVEDSSFNYDSYIKLLDQKKRWFNQRGIKVYGFSFYKNGDKVFENFVENTGGKCYVVDKEQDISFFYKIAAELDQREAEYIAENEKVITVEDSYQELRITAVGSAAQKVELYDPEGRRAVGNKNIMTRGSNLYKKYIIQNPLQGEWTLHQEKNVEIFIEREKNYEPALIPAIRILNLDNRSHLGETVALQAEIHYRGKRLLGDHIITAEVINSAPKVSLKLNDSGENVDLKAGDGIYTSEWIPESEGNYKVCFRAEGAFMGEKFMVTDEIKKWKVIPPPSLKIRLDRTEYSIINPDNIQVSLSIKSHSLKSEKIDLSTESSCWRVKPDSIIVPPFSNRVEQVELKRNNRSCNNVNLVLRTDVKAYETKFNIPVKTHGYLYIFICFGLAISLILTIVVINKKRVKLCGKLIIEEPLGQRVIDLREFNSTKAVFRYKPHHSEGMHREPWIVLSLKRLYTTKFLNNGDIQLKVIKGELYTLKADKKVPVKKVLLYDRIKLFGSNIKIIFIDWEG